VVEHNGRVGLEMAQSQPPDLIILDLMLPGLGGLDICHSLRRGSTTKHIPIIMLTAKSTEDDKLEGLYLGADDYVTKPFSPRELMARIKAVLRRLSHAHSQPDEIGYGDLTINFPQYEVRVGGQRINLTPKEFKILAVLITHPERAFSRAELVEKAFGYDYDGLDRTIDVHVLKLRKKIEADSANPHYSQTVYGVGYKFSNQ
jgi:DNA-binding response OmpR family regulator